MGRQDQSRRYSGSQGPAIGSNAKATVHGSNLSAPASDAVDLKALKVALQGLYVAIDKESLPISARFSSQTAVGSGLSAVESNARDRRGCRTCPEAGEALQSVDVAVREGSSLWASLKKIAEELEPIVGGSAAVAKWFGLLI